MKDYIGIHLSSFKDKSGIYETSLSRLNDNGIPEIVPNADGDTIIPSVVEFLDNKGFIVGHDARSSIGINDENIDLRVGQSGVAPNWDGVDVDEFVVD